MLCASTGDSAGQDLAALTDELSKLCGVLVIDELNLVRTEDANLFSLAVHGASRTYRILVSIHNNEILLLNLFDVC